MFLSASDLQSRFVACADGRRVVTSADGSRDLWIELGMDPYHERPTCPATTCRTEHNTLNVSRSSEYFAYSLKVLLYDNNTHSRHLPTLFPLHPSGIRFLLLLRRDPTGVLQDPLPGRLLPVPAQLIDVGHQAPQILEVCSVKDLRRAHARRGRPLRHRRRAWRLGSLAHLPRPTRARSGWQVIHSIHNSTCRKLSSTATNNF